MVQNYATHLTIGLDNYIAISYMAHSIELFESTMENDGVIHIK